MRGWQVSDQRKGLPSASGAGQWSLCPASPRKQRNLPDIRTSEEAEWAASGDRIHLYLEDSSLVTLDATELDVADRCLIQREEVVTQILEGRPATAHLEKRLWWPSAEDPRTSGQADYVLIADSKAFAVVLDYKTSYGDQAESSDNRQLRTLAVLAWRNYGVQSVYVAIIQPLTGNPVVCHYDTDALEASERQLDHDLARTDDKDAVPVAGPVQCRFCRAKLICPASRAMVADVSALDPDALDVTGEELAALLDKCAVAGMVAESAKSLAKTRITADAEAVPGWCLEPTGDSSAIDDVGAVHSGLVASGYITTEVFIRDCIKIVKGDTEKAIAAHGTLKLSEAKLRFKEVAEPFTTKTPKAPSLKRK